MVILMMASISASAISEFEVSEDSEIEYVIISHDNWSSNGATTTDLNLSDEGKPFLDRPFLTWNSVTGTPTVKTGVAAVSIPERNEVWFIGGRMDPSPLNNGDEVATNTVDIYDVANDTWQAGASLESAQQYAGAVLIDDKVYVVGDWWPTNTNPTKVSTGMFQIFNMSNETWTEGTSLPSGYAVGNAGVAALDGYLYVTGGVKKHTGQDPSNKTFRYDPSTEEWTELAVMNRSRWGLTLTAFDGRLYAIGGADHTSTSWWIQPDVFDDVEVYEPSNDTWWDLPNMPTAVFGHASAIIHEEILVIGGHATSKSKKTWSFNPVTEIWTVHDDLPTELLDIAAAAIGDLVVSGTGDMSNYLYSTWGRMYSGDVNTVGGIQLHEGWLNSPSLDLRPGAEFTCRPTSIDILADTPYGTSIATQMRTHMQASGLSSTMWAGPDGTISSWYETGQTSLNGNNANHLEYRMKISTQELQNWTIPSLDNINIEADHVGFYTSPPPIMHPLSVPIQVVTGHHMREGSSIDRLWVSTSPNSQTSQMMATLSRVNSTGSFTIDDPDGMLTPGSTVSLISSGIGDYQLAWNLSLTDGIQDERLYFGVNSTGILGSVIEHLYSNSVLLDDDLEVAMTKVEARWQGQEDWLDVSGGATVAAGAELRVSVNPRFPSSSIEHSGDQIESRISLVLLMEDEYGNLGWWNSSTVWLEMDVWREHSIVLNSTLNGSLTVSTEARSAIPYNITSSHDSIQLVVDDSEPILIDSEPKDGSYIDSEYNRQVSLLLWEPGGLKLESMELLTWVQAVDDGKNGSALDGLAQTVEMANTEFELEGFGNLIYLNFTLDDSPNSDHGVVEIWLTGEDVVAHQFPENGEGSPYLSWQTRDARTTVLKGMEYNGTFVEGKGLRMEPGVSSGWILELGDENSLLDIQKVELRMGGDDELGVRWLSGGSGCSALDDRLISESVVCSTTYTSDSMFLEISFAPTWRIDPSQLDLGSLEILMVDIDGSELVELDAEQWFLTTDLVVDGLQVEDTSGPVTGILEDGYIIALGDVIEVSATITHGASGNSMEGLVSVRWSGVVHGEEWTGEQAVELVDGVLHTQLLSPPVGGVGELTVEVLDEMGWQSLATIGPLSLIFDDQDPVLLVAATHNPFSRYHLSHMVVTASINDDVEFDNQATAYCQIIADGIQWPAVSVTASPVGIFEERSVFSFQFNMSGLGRPSDLPISAEMICWVEAQDDSGRVLIPQEGGNSNETPWLRMSLTSNGPNLEMTSFTSDSESTVIGDRFRISVTVNNVGETVDTPLVLNITMTSPDGEVSNGWTETRQNGMAENGIWSITIDLWPEQTGQWVFTATIDPEDTVPELDEEDNMLQITVQLEAKPEGFLSSIKVPAMWTGFGLVLVLVSIVALRRFMSTTSVPFSEESMDEEEKELPAISGPPPPSAARPMPASISATISEPVLSTDIASASKALDGLVDEAVKIAEEVSDGIPAIGSKVADWQGLKWAGEYEYDEDGTWYRGEDCGKWKQNDDGSFTRTE